VASALTVVATPVLEQAQGWLIVPFPSSAPASAPGGGSGSAVAPTAGMPVHHVKLDVESCEQNGKYANITQNNNHGEEI